MIQYLIVCPLTFLAGLVDSIAGGGGIISLPAYLLAGVPAHTALGTNKLGSSMGTVVSTVRYAKNGYLKGKAAMAACSAFSRPEAMPTPMCARPAFFMMEETSAKSRLMMTRSE